MKITTTILLFLFSLSLLAQTSIDSLVLIKVNQYRNSKGLESVIFSDVNFKSASHHTNYMVKNSVITHSEDTLVDPSDRLKFYGCTFTNFGENILLTNKNFKSNDPEMNDKIATEIVNIWKKSPGHNKILLDKRFRYIGTSTALETRSVNIKNWLNVTVVSTLVMTN
jgi:uncharacterized protein YkwD